MLLSAGNGFEHSSFPIQKIKLNYVNRWFKRKRN